jgi:ATP-dependent DNA helicase PIF1
MRSEVDRSNEARLRALPGEAVNFQGEDWPSESKGNSSKNTYLSNFMAPEKLVLKVGAQVMLIKNLDTTLVNGTIGKVVGFGVPDLDDEDEEGGEGMKLEDGASERKKAKLVQGAGQGRVELAPVIEWRTPGGVERKMMVREEFKVEDPKGVKLASRKQVRFVRARLDM